MASIMDVAKRAGVSRATVSRVLNNSSEVSEKTKIKVHEVIRELNYEPSIVARNLRKKETRLILVLVPYISNTFYGKLVQAMEEVAKKNDYNLILGVTNFDKESELRYLKMLEQKLVDGIIATVFINSTEAIKRYLNYGPIILTGGYIDEDPFITITIDNIKAVEQALKYITELGHKKIAFINGPENSIASRDRKKGFIKYLKEKNITIYEELIYSGPFTIQNGYTCTQSILKSSVMPTVIFAGSDDIAVGAIRALKANGINIPKDIAVVGFDNKDISTVVDPQLTTIEQPIHKMGKEAMQTLVGILEGKINSEEPKRILLETKLIIRESC